MGKIGQRFKNVFGLSLSLAKARFKLRNEGTWLGIFWYLLNPIITFLLLLGIFKDRLGQNIPSYPLYLLLGILLFNYFRNITGNSTEIIIGNGGLIRSLRFPKESLVGANIFTTLFSHIFEIVILIIFLLFFNLSIKMMIFYPVILLFFSIFLFGFSLLLASLGIYFFDLKNIWTYALSLLWFVTPIFYAVEGQTKLFYLNLLNPLYYFITISREVIIYARFPEMWLLFGALTYSLLFLLLGLLCFNKLKLKFAELV